MNPFFEEIDCQHSSIGDISLRRRRITALGDRDIYEVKLGEEFLMSSMFFDGEVALADLGIAAVDGQNLRVVVGGLGLGYTAQAALQSDRVKELVVIDALDTVISWHTKELIPVAKSLNADDRCRYVLGSFFDIAVNSFENLTTTNSSEAIDVVLLDIDHSPKLFLNDQNRGFYTQASLRRMAKGMRKGGVFAMWSNEAEDQHFIDILRDVFSFATSHKVTFDNPLQNCESFNTVYVARI